MNNGTHLILHLVPKDFWESAANPSEDISAFVTDALVCERRIRKGVNLTNERLRYQLCCRRIQNLGLKAASSWPTQALSDGYYDVLCRLYRQSSEQIMDTRLGTCFFRPNQIQSQIRNFNRITQAAGLADHPDVKWRLHFLGRAADEQAGIIETTDFLIPCEIQTNQTTAHTGLIGSMTAESFHAEDDDLTREQQLGLLETLKLRISKAAKTGEPVNFSNQPHMIITEALNSFVFRNDGNRGDRNPHVRVVYMDGSEAEPFPLFCLDQPELSEPKDISPDQSPRPLKASLVSMRHLEMDETVDLAWFRNRKVSAGGAFAETDAYCTAKTIEMLNGARQLPVYMDLFQTGLETAVIGFYRGLVSVLKQRRENNGPAITIVPRYFIGNSGQYEAGTPWRSIGK